MILTIIFAILAVLISPIVVYAYIRKFAAKKTTYCYKKNTENNKIIEFLKKTVEPFDPLAIFCLPRVKILFQLKKPGEYSMYRRNIVHFSDGGQAALDIYPKNMKIRPNTPVIFLFSGFMTTTTTFYVREAIQQLHEETGYPIIAINRRGFGGVPVTGTCPLGVKMPDDLDQIFEKLEREYSPSAIHIVGFSQGGLRIQQYLSNPDSKCHNLVKSGVAISSPNHPTHSIDIIESKKMINDIIVGKIKLAFKEVMKYEKFQEFLQNNRIDFERDLMSATKLTQIVNNYLLYMTDYKSIEELNQKETWTNYMDNIDLPLLNLNSFLDPISDIGIVQYERIAEHGKVIQVTVGDGDHTIYPHGFSMKNWAISMAAAFVLYHEGETKPVSVEN